MPFLQLGYKRIHYTDLQPKDGKARETFICTHGLGSSQDYYYAIALGLQAHHFRCIIFDTTGAARSPYTQIEQSVESLSEDVIGIMDELKVTKAIVVGHSLGSVIAAHLAAARSDRVVAAVLIGPVYPSKEIVPVFEKRIDAVEKEGMESIANTIPHGAPAKGAPPIVRSFIRELLLGQDPAGYVSHCRVLINAKVPAYSNIAVPVLVIAGEEDATTTPDTARNLFEELGTTEKKLEVLPAVGHWHCLEAAEEVGKQILTFYREIQ